MQRLTRWQKGTTPLLAIVFLALTVLQPLLLLGGEAVAAVDTTAEEARMLQLVNQARNNSGLPSLYAEQRLTDFARSYSSEMVQYGFFGHVSPVSGNLQQRIAAQGITGWTLAGENVAKAPSVDVAFEALMNSPTHRENILRREFNCVGIGVVQASGCRYISQEFMCFPAIPSTADKPAATAPAVPAGPAPPADTFDAYLLVMNPNDGPAQLEVSFQGEDGSSRSFFYRVGANSRFTVPVRETSGAGSFSTSVRSDVPVLAERAMYFSYQGRKGGHDSIGAPRPSTTWFFAEGYTGDAFDTWVLLQNPNDTDATVTLSFMRPDGALITQQVAIPPRCRRSVHLDEVPGLEATDVSTRVTSDLPIVAERAMYFSYQGRKGGHVTIGASAAESRWYLAEGYTGGEFDEYVLFLNPGDERAAVEVVFMRPDGLRVTRALEMAPHSRSTIHVDEVEGLASTEVSTQVDSDQPLVVELAEYFDFRGRGDGNNAMGACQPSTTWYFAEGCVE